MMTPGNYDLIHIVVDLLLAFLIKRRIPKR